MEKILKGVLFGLLALLVGALAAGWLLVILAYLLNL